MKDALTPREPTPYELWERDMRERMGTQRRTTFRSQPLGHVVAQIVLLCAMDAWAPQERDRLWHQAGMPS